MKAITVRQPYASLIASGRKTIETRTWQTAYRGELLVCSGAKTLTPPATYRGAPVDELPRGVAVCLVDLVDVRPMTPQDWAAACCDPYPDAYAWVLENVVPVEPLSVRGQVKFFDVDPRLIRRAARTA